MIATFTETLKTKGRDDCLDITEVVRQAVARAKIRQGLATVFVTGSSHHLRPTAARVRLWWAAVTNAAMVRGEGFLI